MVDVLSEKWDPETKTLSGASLIVDDELYELRIALPAGSKWTLERVVSDCKVSLKEDAGQGLRLTFWPYKSGKVIWQFRFAEG